MSKTVFNYNAATGFAAFVEEMPDHSVSVSTGFVGTGRDNDAAFSLYPDVVSKYGALWTDARMFLRECRFEIETNLANEDASIYQSMRGCSIHGYMAAADALDTYIKDVC